MKYASDHLILAGDPISFNLFYMPKYFQSFNYFIVQDTRTISLAYTVGVGSSGRTGTFIHAKNLLSRFSRERHNNFNITCSNSTSRCVRDSSPSSSRPLPLPLPRPHPRRPLCAHPSSSPFPPSSAPSLIPSRPLPPSSPPPRFQLTPTPNARAMSRVPVRYVTGTLFYALTNPSPLPPRLLPTPLRARPPVHACPRPRFHARLCPRVHARPRPCPRYTPGHALAFTPGHPHFHARARPRVTPGHPHVHARARPRVHALAFTPGHPHVHARARPLVHARARPRMHVRRRPCPRVHARPRPRPRPRANARPHSRVHARPRRVRTRPRPSHALAHRAPPHLHMCVGARMGMGVGG